jgi:hypothetical protein
MKLSEKFSRIIMLIGVMGMIVQAGCKSGNIDNSLPSGREPVIDPDYSGVTIPPNICPMNFVIAEKGDHFLINALSPDGTCITVKSSDGTVQFPVKSWQRLLRGSAGGKIEIDVISEDDRGKGIKYNPIFLNVATDPVDPYLCYRSLFPGYKYWVELKIVQRSTVDFNEESLFENQLLEDNCVNCHSFLQNSSERFLLHVRGSRDGTYFVNGDRVTRTILRTQNMPANAVYPAWHPSGRYVAFSSNKTGQLFHMSPGKNIEVTDEFSSLVIYDTEKNEIFACPENDTIKYMETFPCWSPDGEYLYYCRAKQVKESDNYMQVKYDLVRKSFNKVSCVFGNAEIVFNALVINKSVSFPAISPDGKYLVFTLHDYGTFSIWHKEADLYLLNLQDGKVDKMSLNSNETESWHSWSSNGRWLVFSSKRGDGLTARPYFAYFGSPDNVGKPFVLPQKDPTLYKRMLETFNRPEFVTGKIKVGPRDFERASKKDPIKASWRTK